MTNYFWTGAADTNSLNASNWIPSAVPGAGDVVIFDNQATQDCFWQHAATGASITVDEMILEDSFQYALRLQTVPTIKGMFLNKNIRDGTANNITFASGPISSGGYKTYNSKYVLIGDNAVYTNGRQNLTFEFNATAVCAFDDGQHPKIHLKSGNYTPKYTTPTGTSGKTDFYQLEIDAGCTLTPDVSIATDDKNKKFKFASQTTTQFVCNIATVNWGSSTVEFTGVTSSTFNLPVSTTTNYNSGDFFAQYRKVILTADTAGYRIDMQDNTFLSVEEFEIGDGLLFVGPRELNAQGSDIRTILPPKIRGSWSFSSISDGIYRSPRQASGPMPKVQGNFHITGKLTVDGLIDPTGMVFTPQASNPESTNPEDTIWINSGTGHLMRGDRDTESTVHYNVRNDSGVTIPIGTPLYSKGEIGGSDRIKVGIADASDPATMPAIGIAMEEMNTNSTKDGNMILTGVLNENITITGVTERDTIYVAPHGGTAPYLTVTRPTSGSHLVQNIGVCVRQASANTLQGMYVSAIGRTNDIPNGVITTNSADADYVYIDDGNTFKKITPSDLGIGGGGGGGDITEVNTNAPITGGATSGAVTLSLSASSASAAGSMSSAHYSKLEGIEASADVTDTDNVTAAGALMDSEVTNLAQVKAFDSADYATATQGTTADNALPKAGGTMTGEIEATTITLNAVPADPATDDKVRIGESGGTSNMFMIQTNDGYIQLGPNNTGYAHLQTDRAQFYFSKPITYSGNKIYAYSGGMQLGTGSTAASGTTAITVAHGSTDITVAGNIAVGGTVDGRDLSVDGAKLDGIAAGATAYTDGDAIAAVTPLINNNTNLINTNTTAITEVTVKASKCFAYLSGNQSYSSGTVHITHDTTLWNVGGNYDTASKWYVAPRDGYYLVACSYYFTSAPSWAMSVVQVDTGSGFAFRIRRLSVNGQDNMISAVIKLNTGDKVAHYAHAGGSGTIGAALNTLTYFSVTEMI